MKKEKKKEAFYSKGSDLYGYSVFEEGETPTGCGMYSVDYYSSFAQKDLDNMSDDDYIDYDDCYLYLSNLSKLYYIKDRKLQEINLNDEREFKSELLKFMNTEDDKFTLRRMSYTDIFRVITRTSGHMPVHMVSATPPSPYEKYQTYKGLYEFYLQQKATELLPSPPYRHSHIVDKGDWHDVLIVEKCDEDPCDRPRYRPF